MTDLMLSHSEEVETGSSAASRLFQILYLLVFWTCSLFSGGTDKGKSHICCPVLVFVKVDVAAKVTCETI